jgi:hypothetical protein
MTTTRPEYNPLDHVTAESPSGLTRQWQAWINARVARSEKRMLKVCMETVGAVLVEERRKLKAEFDVELLKIRAEFLQNELDKQRGARRVRLGRCRRSRETAHPDKRIGCGAIMHTAWLKHSLH